MKPNNRQYKLILALVAVALLAAGCGRRKTGGLGGGLDGSVEPDRVLYERALEDIKKGKHVAARLNLMTLINTYPDSEFLAKAKLAVADSYYKEGGTSGLTMAVQEYKDFRTFFPFLEEAAYAQYQVGMAHYRRMEKPDRDRSQARNAEAEFQEFLRSYPGHERYQDAEQRLREIQEVLAEGDYRVARYYYVKGSYRAAGGRLIDLTDRYPLYSNSDRALMMLGDIFERSEREDLAGRFYARVVKDYPLSALTAQAKERLEALGVPVPQPDPAALERMQREAEHAKERTGMLGRTLGMFKSGPDVSMAARTGEPNMNPPVESTATFQSLGGGGGNFSVGVGGVTPGGSASGGGSSGASTAETSEGKTATAATGEAKASDLPQRVDPKTGKQKDGKKKDGKESSSKKKKGLRKIIPW
jgi:outer membrane protein assembly factor BamD